MNLKQIIIVVAATIAIAVAFLMPSWESYKLTETNQGQVLMAKYESRLFNDSPEHSDVKEPRVVWRYAAQEAIAYAVVAGILCYLLRTRKARVVAESQNSVSAAAAF